MNSETQRDSSVNSKTHKETYSPRIPFLLGRGGSKLIGYKLLKALAFHKLPFRNTHPRDSKNIQMNGESPIIPKCHQINKHNNLNIFS